MMPSPFSGMDPYIEAKYLWGDFHNNLASQIQAELNTATIHLVEIDFLRGGTRPPLLRPVPKAPYYIILSRAEVRPKATVWPIQLSDKLPIISVPLNYPDPDTNLDMAKVVADVYDRCAYGVQLNYAEAPPPPKLSEEQQKFVDELLKPLRL